MRQARCSCGKVATSSPDLPFFTAQDAGSDRALSSCKHCGYHEVAHRHDVRRVEPRSVVERGVCPGFEAHGPFDHDHWYCGHSGWD